MCKAILLFCLSDIYSRNPLSLRTTRRILLNIRLYQTYITGLMKSNVELKDTLRYSDHCNYLMNINITLSLCGLCDRLTLVTYLVEYVSRESYQLFWQGLDTRGPSPLCACPVWILADVCRGQTDIHPPIYFIFK